MGQTFNVILDICTLVGGLASFPIIWQFVKGLWRRVRPQGSPQGESAIAIHTIKPSIKKPPARVVYVSRESVFLKGLIAALPWALLFAGVGEYLLVAVFGLSHSSVPYTLLILLFWAAGIPVGLAVRNRPRKISLLVAGVGVVAVIAVYSVLTHINPSYLSK